LRYLRVTKSVLPPRAETKRDEFERSVIQRAQYGDQDTFAAVSGSMTTWLNVQLKVTTTNLK